MSVTAFNRRRRELAAAEAAKAAPAANNAPKAPTYDEIKAEAAALGLEFKSNIKKKDFVAMIVAKKAEIEAAAEQLQTLKDQAAALGLEVAEDATAETLAAAIEAKQNELANQE